MMLQEAILSLYLFSHPVLTFEPIQNVNLIEEMKKTNDTYKIAEAVRNDERQEAKYHIMQVASTNKKEEVKAIESKKEESEWLKFEISAYTNGKESTNKVKGDKDYGRTASGRMTKEGRTVSADVSLFPFGTVLYIDGVGERVVEDTGSAIIGYKLDLFIEDLKEARQFGRKYDVKVKVIKMGEKKK
ncbi:3D domain-containing protein [Paenibacillus tianjinensis]|uniref:3D domain-containing protein n=1 Tax=Paenibacillus tianjinensis TaxID=2810347 RepID=A0ABX7L6B2_9BACL|nr:3D domain-containing protein [Paenibacillus tianjinensis]QSF43462.1 3D domain-containing protein [Paenibacillus tianjinensis]